MSILCFFITLTSNRYESFTLFHYILKDKCSTLSSIMFKSWKILYSSKDKNIFISRQSNMNLSKTKLNIGTPGRVAQSVGHLTGKSEVLGSIPGLVTYFRFSFR